MPTALDFNAGAIPRPAPVVDMSEPPEPYVPEGVPPAPPRPPPWADLEEALADVDEEDASHAVEAWRELVVRNGRNLPDWDSNYESGVKSFTDDYQDRLKERVVFNPKDRPFKHLANEVVINPMRPADGLNEAWRAGLIEKPDVENYKAALNIQSLAEQNRALLESAGGNQEGKALAVGAGRGAAFLAGAIPTASAFSWSGPATYGAGPLIAGAVGGTITSMGYDELLEKVAENNKTIESFAASAKLKPQWTAGGELLSFAVPAPLGVARGIRRFQLVAENLGPKVALKQAAKYIAVSGGVGAASTPVMAALDRWKNESLGLGHDPNASLFDPTSITANTVLAIMLGNLGVKFKNYSQGEAAGIHQRGMAGQKLSAAEQEVFNTINRKIAQDPKKFVFEVEQATMGGKPLDGAVGVRMRSGQPQGEAARATQPGPAPGSSGTSQQQQGGAQTPPGGGASGSASTQRPGAASGTAGAQAPKPQRFSTQDEFNTFFDEAFARGDTEAASQAWAMNNSGPNKKYFPKWYFQRMQGGDADAGLFANSVNYGRTNAQHAEFVRQQKSATQGNGPATGPTSSAAASQPGGTSSTAAGSGPSVPRGGQRGGPNDVSQQRSAGAPVRRDEGLGQNTPGSVEGAAPGALPGPVTDAARAGIALSPVIAGAALSPTNKQALVDDPQRIYDELMGITPTAPAGDEPGPIPESLLSFLDPEQAPGAPAAEPTPSAPLPAVKMTPKQKAGAAAINEILRINGETPKPGQSLYVIADADGTPIEVFTNHAEGYQHLQSMASRDEWLWSVPSDFSGAAVLEGGLPPLSGARGRAKPSRDPFGNKFAGEVPAPGSRAPLEPDAPTETKFARQAIVEVPISRLRISDDVPQFKSGADARGIVEPLAGKFDRTGVGPIQIWERLNGDLEVISGRHRLDLAERSGEETIPAQIHREADGFTALQAATIDAELNIRDGQGSVSDYANYFRNSKTTEAEANASGLLGRAKGKAGFAIGTRASEDTFALHQSGQLADAQAQAIADTAPSDAAAQAVGIRGALDGKSAIYISNLMRAAKLRASDRQAKGEQFDLFSFDDSAIAEMDAQAKVASAAQKGIREQISAVQGAAKRPAVASKLGVDVKDPAGVQKRIAALRAELDRWENWPMHADLVAVTREYEVAAETESAPQTPKLRPGEKGTGDLLQGEDAPFNLMGEQATDTLKAAREKEAAEQAAADAREQQDREQGNLFEDAPSPEAAALPPGELDAIIETGAKVLAEKPTFAEWADEMISLLGDKVAPVLHDAWASLTGAEFKTQRTMSGKRYDVRNETGAIFGSGRRRRGRQADALPEEERILSTRAFWEGAADVFLKHALFKPLGKAINRQVDLADKHLGKTTAKFEAWEARTNRSDRKDAKDTLSRYIDARESGRTADARAILAAASPAAKDLIKTVGDVAEYTGKVSTTLVQPNGRIGVEVMGEDGPRPLRNLGKDFWPRILKGQYDAALRDPLSNPDLWQQMRQDLVANGNVANIADADTFLKGGGSNDAANEFLGSLYRARSGRLPPHWHDTSLEGFESWATRWSDIVSKIEAFNQKIRPDDTDLFDEALKLTTHAPTRSYIHSVRARAYNERDVGFLSKYLLDAPRLLASGLFLTNPVTIGVNATSAKLMNTFTYGLRASFGRNPLAMFTKGNHLDAYALGVLKRDMVRLLYRDDMPGLDGLKSFVNGAMKFSGYEAVENLTRVDTYLTALAFLHNGLAAVRKNPTGASAVGFMAFLKRNHYDIGAIVRENGMGEATDAFLRGTIKDTQGGYSYAQVPWWTDTPLGKFFLQFSKFGAQFTRNVMHNVIRPAFAMDKVTYKINGKTVEKRHWDPRPLLYFLAGSVIGGEFINWMKEKAFGIERRDATFDEIAATMSESTRDGLVLIAVRMLNDMLTLGTLGIFGTPIQAATDVTRSRFRNPLAPPGVSLATNVGQLIQSGVEQKTITDDDIAELVKSSVPMYRYADAFVKEQANNLDFIWKAAELKSRQDDVRFLRNVAGRFAEEVDLPTQRMTSQGRRAKDELTPMRADLMDALLIGDEEEARRIVADYLHTVPSLAEKKHKLESLSSVVSSNQPARVGGIAGNERRVEFMQWAKKKLSPEDLARVQAVDETYRTTAKAVGLMKANTPRDDAKLLRKIEREDMKLEREATPAESERFIEENLRPKSRRIRLGGFR